MSNPMVLRDEDVGRIGEYVKPWLREIVNQMTPKPEFAGIGPQLLERMVRIEEELSAQRELMGERFGFMDRRFDAVSQRFEAMDQRFESINQRFEAVDQRFEDLFRYMDSRFSTLTWMIGIGFVVITSLTTVFAILA